MLTRALARGVDGGGIARVLALGSDGKVMLEAESIEIGTIDQGAPGASPWPFKIADGDAATLGTKADAVYAGSGAATLIGIEKGVYSQLQAISAALAAGIPVYPSSLWNVATSGWETQRTPTVYKTVTATAAGDTAIWTPTSGKKFRLLGFLIVVPANCAVTTGAIQDIALRDNTTATGLTFSVFIPGAGVTSAVSPASATSTPLEPGGNGYLSTAANNVLNINLPNTINSGKIRVTAWGTEE